MSSELSPERPPKISAKQKPRFPRDGKKWQALLRAYETPNAARSLVEIALTLSLFRAVAYRRATRQHWMVGVPANQHFNGGDTDADFHPIS